MEMTAAASPRQKPPRSPRTPAHRRDGPFDPPHISCHLPYPTSARYISLFYPSPAESSLWSLIFVIFTYFNAVS